MSPLILWLVACPPPPDEPVDSAEPACAPWVPLQRGTSGWDEVRALGEADGAVLVAGFEGGASDGRFELAGAAHGFLDGYVGGTVAWHTAVDTTGADSVDVLLAEGSEVLVAGRVEGDLPSLPSYGQHDWFVGRLTGHDLEVLARGGDPGPQLPRRLARHGDGLVLSGRNDVYVPTNYVERWEDSRVDRLRADLALEWTVMGTSAASDWSDGLLVTSDDRVLVAGGTGAGLDRGPWVEALDHTGRTVWRTSLSPVAQDTAVALVPGRDGLVLVVGSTFLAPSAGQQDIYVAALDPADGAVRWTSHWGSAGTDWVTDAVVAPDGTLLVVGETDGSLLPDAQTRGPYDVFAVAFDTDGVALAAWQDGTEGDEHAGTVAVDGCGRLLVGGWTTGTWPGTEARGGRDAFVVQATLQELPAAR